MSLDRLNSTFVEILMILLYDSDHSSGHVFTRVKNFDET